ncbi:MAG: carbohydrate-binding domain-containing protein [Ancrocorticia populi]|uniref:carbohydrate-binding domain-containing protein n=1 Tax=Ancrocorticia populi TaxID=2175228 RepID=UPI003F9100F6
MTLSNRFSEGKWTSHGSKNTAAFVTLALASAVTLSACSSDSDEASADETATESTAVAITDVSNLEDATHYSESDADYEEADVTEIALDGDTASATGANSDGVAVEEADGEAVITVTGGGTYRFSGELSGHVVITADSEEDVQVILNGATITSDTDAAVSITEADEATVIVADGTENTLTDGSTRDEDVDDVANAALYSKADLTITGTGQLTVDGTYEDGIHSKDGLVITGPNVTVEDADDGIIGKDYLVLVDGTVDITSVDTGFGSDNEDDADRGWLSILGGSITVDTGDDAIKAENALAIAEGTVLVTASEEAIEAANIEILGGDIDLTSADDAINAAGGYGTESSDTDDDPQGDMGGQPPQNGEMPTDMPTDMTQGGGQPPQGGGGMDQAGNQSVTISGGTIVMDAEGDGLDSNGSITMTGGDVTVNGPVNGGNGAIDFAGTFDISGGTLLAIGSSGMAEAPDTDSDQASLSITLSETVNSGATLAVADADGNIVTTFTTIKEIQSVVFSSADVTSGTEYTVYQVEDGATDVSDGTELGTGTAGEYTNAM